MPAKKFVALFALTLSLMAVLATAMAHAEDYPARVVKIVVPFPAGGTADPAARYRRVAVAQMGPVGHH
jgi:tripartite-type tricarboxylate transporter receptor subunit TctC